MIETIRAQQSLINALKNASSGSQDPGAESKEKPVDSAAPAQDTCRGSRLG